jgi:hypothetical protein
MNVFVLSTGRCGSTTIARAFGHAVNFTSGHETRANFVDGRLDYPDQHIESDNRLCWFLGSLDRRYGERARWIHLTRDPDEVIESYWRRWERIVANRRVTAIVRHPARSGTWFREWLRDPTSTHRTSIVQAFGYHVVMSLEPLTSAERRDVCALYVRTVTDNVESFLAGRPGVSRVRVEHFADDFTAAWRAIDAEGSLEAALSDLTIRYNRAPGRA